MSNIFIVKCYAQDFKPGGLCKIMESSLFFLSVSVSCSGLTLTCFLQSDFGRPTIDLGMHDSGNLGYEVSCLSDFQDSLCLRNFICRSLTLKCNCFNWGTWKQSQ